MTDRFDDDRPAGQAPPPADEPTLPASDPTRPPDEPTLPADAPTPPMGIPRPPGPGQAGPGQPGAGPPPYVAPGDEPGGGQPPPYVPPDEPADRPRRGQMRYQDPETARPRPPSLAEQRARLAAERESEERAVAEAADVARKRKRRRRLLIGSGVTVGVVAIVAIWYAASRPDEVTAYCVGEDEVVNEDDNCDENYVRSHGGYYSGGFFFLPGGRQYHYYYGGNPTPLGSRVSGGSTVRPQGASIVTRSGKSIQRGGFGVRGGSGKSSGS